MAADPLSFRITSLIRDYPGEIVEACKNSGVISAKHELSTCNDIAEQPFRLGVTALPGNREGKIMSRNQNFSMFLTEDSLLVTEHLAVQLLSFRIPTLFGSHPRNAMAGC